MTNITKAVMKPVLSESMNTFLLPCLLFLPLFLASCAPSLSDLILKRDAVKVKEYFDKGGMEKDYYMNLVAAAATGQAGVVQLLLQKGAKPDPDTDRLQRNSTPDNKKAYASTPLMWAIGEGHYDVVKLLLDNGANVNMAGDLSGDDNSYDKLCGNKSYTYHAKMNMMMSFCLSGAGWTPLMIAAAYGRAGIADLLMEHGANVNATAENPKITPLSVALHKFYPHGVADSQTVIAESLLAKGAKVPADSCLLVLRENLTVKKWIRLEGSFTICPAFPDVVFLLPPGSCKFEVEYGNFTSAESTGKGYVAQTGSATAVLEQQLKPGHAYCVDYRADKPANTFKSWIKEY